MWSLFAYQYIARPFKWLLQLLSNYLWWTYHVFGLGRHLRQLFVPWHRLVAEKTQRGFSMSAWFDRVTYNIISRVIGAFLRIFVVLTGLGVGVLLVLLWSGLLLVWLASLVLLPLVYVYFIWRLKSWQHQLNGLSTSVEQARKYFEHSSLFRGVMGRLGVSVEQAEQVLQTVKWTLSTELAATWMAQLPSKQTKLAIIEAYLTSDQVTAWLQRQKISPTDIKQSIDWYVQEHYAQQVRRRFWLRVNLQKTPAIGKSWSYGYTPRLNQFAEDLALDVSAELVLTGRESTLEQLELIFSKAARTNILLIGPDGVGKMSICRLFAKHIGDGQTTPQLADHRVLLLDLTTLLASKEQLTAQLQELRLVLQEASAAGNCVMVIPDFDQYLDPDTTTPDVSHIFKEIEEDARIKIIGLMNPTGYERSVSLNPVIETAFEIVQLQPMTQEETLAVLLRDLRLVEREHGVFIEFPALQALVKLSDKILIKQSFPQKAFNLLDEILATARMKQTRRITAGFVQQVLSQRSGVQLQSVMATEAMSLQQIEQRLAQRVVGQQSALAAVAAGMQRARLGLSGTGKPVVTLLFLGPTGVGKTETAKAVANVVYGSDRVLQRFDCAQYGSDESVEVLIGTPSKNGKAARSGALTAAIEAQPQGVILFDELEKAHPSVHNILLTLLDEGYLVDGLGNRVSFEHSVVICTANAASDLISQRFGQLTENRQNRVEEIRTEVIQHLIEQRIFSPEFLNRFDEIIVFEPLTREQLRVIAQMKIADLSRSVHEEHGIFVEVSPSTLEQLIEKAYDPRFGARELERVIRRDIVDAISQRLLDNQLAAGETLVIENL
ncbi:MAG: AAA family ATPase [Patescibacteria group bacterium]